MTILFSIIGVLVCFGLLIYGLAFLWAFLEQRRWDRMDMDSRLRHFLKKRGGKL